MSILGLTIDYGPYGWLEGFDFGWTPNTTDAQNKRYRYGNQPNIALWNLMQLANALYPLIEEAKPLQEILHNFSNEYDEQFLNMMQSKLGLELNRNEDSVLIKNLEDCLLLTETDMTLFFRLLSNFDENKSDGWYEVISNSFYKPDEVKGKVKSDWDSFFLDYAKRLKTESLTLKGRQHRMNAVNPKYVLRNYMAQLAIDAADNGDYTIIDEIYELLKKPYDEQPDSEKWFAKRPEWARHKVGCSMLSCSS